jgi:hypothetical protein
MSLSGSLSQRSQSGEAVHKQCKDKRIPIRKISTYDGSGFDLEKFPGSAQFWRE